MKKSIIIILSVMLGLTSCDDFLSLSPEYVINEEDFYKSENDYETAVIGIYDRLQSLHNLSTLYLGELTTDNTIINWTAPTTGEQECDELNITSSNSYVNSLWVTCYSAIANSNNILARINDISMDESTRNQYEGEASFIRAYCYFYLVRFFGKVPIVKVAFRSPDEVSSFDMTRQPVSDVYNLIEEDLQNAASLLSGIDMVKGRASSGAAKTLLGKAYLTKGDYVSAATVLKEVIDSGDYDLVDDYGSLFDGSNEHSVESIFEIEYLSGDLGEGNTFSYMFSPALFNMMLFINNQQGAGRLTPTKDLFESYDVGDLRKNASVADSVLTTDGTYEHTLYGFKFVDFSTSKVNGDGGINFTSLRYADVLLMYAEALNENNQTSSAFTYLNMVRNRAGLNELDGLSKEEVALALEKERRVEFLYEGHRWFDLVRTGRAKTVMNNYFINAGMSFSLEDYELLMPIPSNEISISPELEQNPNY